MLNKIVSSMCLMLFSANIFAGASDIKSSNNQIGLQSISTNVDYTETGNGTLGTATGTLDTEKGDVPGYAIFISTMTGDDNQYFEAGYDHSKGQTNYIGSLMGGTFGSVASSSSAALINYNVRYGKGFLIDSVGSEPVVPLMLTPYVELGRHQWDRGVNYGETYTNDYFAIGTLWQFSPVIGQLVVTANAMFGTTFRSNISVNSGPGLNGFSGALGSSSIYKLGISADYAFTKHLHGNAGFDYTSFSYGMSAVYPVGGGIVAWEPDSKTNYSVFKIGIGYAF
ncbi:hypothetical protein GALL_168870 [mine drainage metagenome]|uniref:Outer membrane protein beta-barrel domain-containing protein n=1 Tax=mine drainage metagenome TaxID=410659 RepID=A0A1J5RY87_9ZZZZ